MIVRCVSIWRPHNSRFTKAAQRASFLQGQDPCIGANKTFCNLVKQKNQEVFTAEGLHLEVMM